MIRVRATNKGYVGNILREPGDVFDIEEDQFSDNWMVRAPDEKREVRGEVHIDPLKRGHGDRPRPVGDQRTVDDLLNTVKQENPPMERMPERAPRPDNPRMEAREEKEAEEAKLKAKTEAREAKVSGATTAVKTEVKPAAINPTAPTTKPK